MTSPATIGQNAYLYNGAPPRSERQQAMDQVNSMEFYRQSMIPWWRELGNFFSPRSPRIDLWKENRGNNLNRHILDETAIFARRTLAAGLHWGITNPSRQWKVLSVTDTELAELQEVKDWLHIVNERMDTVLGRGGFYDAQAMAYDDVITFANAAYAVEEDDEDVIRCTPFAIGSWSISDDAKGNVTAFSRTFIMTTRQMVERFGYRNGKPSMAMFSQRVQDSIKDKKWEDKYEIVHLICPNADFDGVRETPDAKRFASLYWEQGASPVDANEQFLAKEGYDEWPVMVFRWRKVPDDPFGVGCPAMDILGTTKSSQKVESKALKLVDKAVDPALVGPSSLANKRVSLLPGDITTDDDRDKQLRPIHEIQLAGLSAVRDAQADMRSRIHDAFYTKLMMFIVNDTRADRPTAREVQEVSQEKYLVLGTVLESFNRTFSVLIDRVFGIMLRKGLIPPPPPVLEGMELKVEYTSIMAQAQKSVGLANIREFLYTIGDLMKIDPSIGRKVDWLQSVDEIAIRSGLPPRMVKSDEDVAEEDAVVAEQMAQQQRVEQGAMEAKAIKDLGTTPAGGDTALSALTQAAGQGSLSGAVL
jgi:Bacteriophage head to tail connecting protein